MEKITPVLDLEHIQQKANEYALKGAEKALEEFYTGYNSPYRKAIEENLKHKGCDTNFDLPDIVALINDKLTQQIDEIANTAVAKTFIPYVKEFLSREDGEILFSDILKEFIKFTMYEPDNEDFDIDDYKVEIIKEKRYYTSQSLTDTFPVYQISNNEKGYELRFYVSDNKTTTTLMSIPTYVENGKVSYNSNEMKSVMKLSVEGGATLEMPFTRAVLHNNFLRYCARLVIGNCNITFDCQDFDEDMFPQSECHCN